MSELKLKLFILGDMSVGKTSVVFAYIKEAFLQDKAQKIEAYYYKVNLQKRKTDIIWEICNMTGDELGQKIPQQYSRKSHAALLVYDVTSMRSFEQVRPFLPLHIKMLYKTLYEKPGNTIFLAVAGNKCDLEESRVVSELEVCRYCKEIGAVHFEVSARTGYGIEFMFKSLTFRFYLNLVLETIDHMVTMLIKANKDFKENV